MSLKSLTNVTDQVKLIQDLNENFSDLETRKASTTDLTNFIPKTEKGIANGVATLDASSEVIQKAKTATQADNYNASTGTIKTKFDSVDSEINNIKNGNTVVGKAKDLAPDTPPGFNMMYGTTAGSQTPSWIPQPVVEAGGYTGPTIENFAATDARWSTPIDDVYTLSIAHGGRYPFAVFETSGGIATQVMATIQRGSVNIMIRSMEKFDGYVGLV